MGDGDPGRRTFLKLASCALGGGAGLVAAGPALRTLGVALTDTTVTTPTEPLELGLVDRFKLGDPPRKVDVVAPTITDAWTTARNVVLGAAWIRRTAPDKLDALSAVCPHLGCTIGWDAGAGNFLCPCHDSRFAVTGERLTGPAQRGLDPLPVAIKDGRLQLTWIRYRAGTATRERA